MVDTPSITVFSQKLSTGSLFSSMIVWMEVKMVRIRGRRGIGATRKKSSNNNHNSFTKLNMSRIVINQLVPKSYVWGSIRKCL